MYLQTLSILHRLAQWRHRHRHSNRPFVRGLIFGTFVLLICSPQGALHAQTVQSFGEYEVHYMAIPTTLLTPEIASQYKIVRSRSTGIVNITVLHKPSGTDTAEARSVPAFLRGQVRNDVQQGRALEFQRITEGRSIYAIAPFWYSQGEIYTFDLEIQADPERAAFQLRFAQALYPD